MHLARRRLAALGIAVALAVALLAATVTGGAEDAQSGPSTSQVARAGNGSEFCVIEHLDLGRLEQ